MLNTASPKQRLKALNPRFSFKLFQAILNNFLENTGELITSYLEQTGTAWWVEIITKKPDCTYYFGPFASHREAQVSQLGYIEDLERERPQLIAIEIKQCQPKELTIFEDEWKDKVDSPSLQGMSA
ncbi:DUF1816 domain-containing protein [Allocoleopsis sp.]|uniref:DUF1816 domain-containing protein n=1 Tax=Allocoleopsis sp. TaxID=3088169 RepID=UPI002FCF7DA5